MKFVWLIWFGVVAILLIKENSSVPAIRSSSQRGIIFPTDNWDNCYLDDASTHTGLCKKLEECPDILKKWDEESVYPKTCYFIKKQQFVCCPMTANKDDFTEKINSIFNTNITTATEKPDDFNSLLSIFNTEPDTFTSNQQIKDANTTYRPSNIFLDKITTTTERPGSMVWENVNATQKPSTSVQPPFDIFVTEPSSFIKRRSETECDIQTPQKFDSIDVNGPPSEPFEFPFMAIFGWRSDIDNKVWYPCGGILISSKFVLTAAHCADIGGITPSFIQLGDKNLTESEEGTIKIKRFIVHPGYNETAINNDIALVELEQEVDNYMACLWTQHDLPIAKFIALGYGRSSFESISANQMFKVALTPIDNSECQEIYKLDYQLKSIQIAESHLCAGDLENFRHFCEGDTGGPLIVELNNVVYVVAITSFGLGCADLPPSVFTRVSSFIDWIEPIVWPEIDVRIV